MRLRLSLSLMIVALLVQSAFAQQTKHEPRHSDAAVFRDVPTSNMRTWASEHIGRLVQAGILEGYPDRTFRGNQPVTRNELAIVLSRLMKM